ncbi:MAG: acyltransferase domain-containing protein, partial [Nocardiopsaceae bacterium]|nr:acyltransferase domain-containing protein [Nocardiopsaceae bacterium]
MLLGPKPEQLAALAAGQVAEGMVRGVAPASAREAVFVFPGQGSQWAGMAAGLLAESPVFAAKMRDCADALRPFTDWSLADALTDARALERVDVVQPVSWAVMVSLAAVWRSYGVRPAAVAGHSQGEIAAACVAGLLTLEDGARVVALRSRAIASLAGQGGMVAVPLPPDRVPLLGRLHVAAVNGPRSTVVSGESEALDEVLALVEGARRIPVSYASHSPQVEAIRSRLLTELAPVRPRPGDVPFYSAVTGERAAALDAGYWYRNLRETVRFEQATRALLGYGAFIEVSPHPVLTVPVQETVEAAGADAIVLGTLRRDEGGTERFLTSLAEAHVHGVPVDWRPAFGPGRPGRVVDLPTYPFQRTRFWLGDLAGRRILDETARLAEAGGVLFTGRVSLDAQPWLADHAVHGVVLLPGTAIVDMVIAAGQRLGRGYLDELTLEAPVAVPERGPVDLQVWIGDPDERGHRPLRLHSRVDDRPWIRNATGVLATRVVATRVVTTGVEATGVLAESESADPGPNEADAADAADAAFLSWPPSGTALVAEPDDFYQRLASAGLGYGPVFRGLRAAWRRGDEVFAEVVLPEEAADPAPGGQALPPRAHPALLDAALHAIAAGGPLEGSLDGGPDGKLEGGLDGGPDGSMAQLPFCWRGVRLRETRATTARVRLTAAGPGAVRVVMADPAGRLIGSVDSLSLRPVSGSQLPRPGDPGQRDPGLGDPGLGDPGLGESLFRVDWTALPPAVGSPAAGITRFEDLPADGPPPSGLVVARCSAGTDGSSGTGDSGRAAVKRALDLLRGWLADDRSADATLVILTRGAVAVRPGEDVADLATAAVWGLVRSAQTENPGRLMLVDTDPEASPDLKANTGPEVDIGLDAPGLDDRDSENPGGSEGPREALAPALATVLATALAAGEPQIALRGGEAYVPRLVRVDPGTAPVPGTRLDTTTAGVLDSLRFVPGGPGLTPLEEGQVRVAIEAAGINFRDALIALGMYPGDAVLGAEGAGVVVETAP